MRNIFFGVFFIIISVFFTNPVCFGDILTDDVHVAVIVAERPDAQWEISIKDGDYPNGSDISEIDTSTVQMIAMGNRELVLGKVYLKLKTFDLYEVVVYTNSMDIDNDGVPNLPWNWDQKPLMVKQDFIDRHAGLQVQNPDYIDFEGFNSLLYGAPLKIRSEGIHGMAAVDGPICYDADNDGMMESMISLMVNQTIPVQLWDARLYPNQVQFTYIPELASESLLGNQPVRVAGSIYQSPIIGYGGTENWLEMVFATSERDVGSEQYATDIYFDLRWN